MQVDHKMIQDLGEQECDIIISSANNDDFLNCQVHNAVELEKKKNERRHVFDDRIHWSDKVMDIP